MNILILCDRESTRHNNQDLCAHVLAAAKKASNTAHAIVLNGDEIHPCHGCFHCWLKTPGLCIMTDDCANSVARAEIRSDVVILLSKITYGGFSYDVKSFLDRSIANLSPFFEIINGEMHHKMRYDQFPDIITIGYGEHTPQEDQTFIDLAERNARNMRPRKFLALTMQTPAEVSSVWEKLEEIFAQEMQCQR